MHLVAWNFRVKSICAHSDPLPPTIRVEQYWVFRPFLKSSLPKTNVGHLAAFLVWFEVLFAFDGTKFVFKNFFGKLGIGRNTFELMKNSYFNSNKSDHQAHWLSEWTSIATATKYVFQLVSTIRPEKKICFYNGAVYPYFLRRPLTFHEISKSYLKLLSNDNKSLVISSYFCDLLSLSYKRHHNPLLIRNRS